MAEDAIELVKLRKNFYRDNYRRVAAVMLILVVLAFILAGTLFYMVSNPPQPKYFATRSDGGIIELSPLNRPNQRLPVVLQWAATAAVNSMTFDFANYRKQLQTSAVHFTRGGWNNFLRALAKSNIMNTVIAQQVFVSAVVTKAPVLVGTRVLGGVYAWRINMPLLVTYESAGQQPRTQRWVLTLTVVRVSSLDNSQGLGISQWIATPKS